MDNIFKSKIDIDGNFINLAVDKLPVNQNQTNDVFSEKWSKYSLSRSKEKLYSMQKKWYLKLYGFSSEEEFSEYLSNKRIIFDAGCGLGYKAKWFADLAPDATVFAMDYSDASIIAAESYVDTKNLYFLKGDIASLPFKDGVIDYVSCDQVIMHTEIPEKTFDELTRVTKVNGEFACYVYAKKALSRELLDDYFRENVKDFSNDQLWEMSEQLTELGKRLTKLNVEVDVPEITMLGIKSGKMPIQRFIYWNFLKCFWNDELGRETSIVTNYDWYAPSNAKRFSEIEYRELIAKQNLEIQYFHIEEACYSGRFRK